MATVILASGNTAAVSADITLTDGQVANIVAIVPDTYKGPSSTAGIQVEWKRADNTYQVIGQLGTDVELRSVKLSDAGTYRLSRAAQTNPIGAEKG